MAKFLNNIDLNKNELQNAKLQNLAIAPSNPVAGQAYFNTTDSKAYIYDGTRWVDMTTESFTPTLTQDLVVSNPIGRYDNGDTIEQGTTYEQVFRGMLTQVYYPTLTNPSASLSYTISTPAKVGSQVTSKNATLSFNRGSINPQYTAESGYRAGAATEYAVALSGASVEYSDTNTTGAAFTVPAFTRNSKGNVTLTGTVSYAAGVQPKDSDGANYQSPLPAGSVSATKTIEFILAFYYGANNTFDVSSFSGLSESVTKKGNKTFSITTNNQYNVIAYDSAYGNLTSILDANNFELIEGWTKSTKTIDGQSYNVYVSNSPTTDTQAQFTFKF